METRQAQQAEGWMTKFSPQLRFALLGAISLAIWWRPLTTTLVLAANDGQYTHIFLIVPVSAVLIFLEWRSVDGTLEPNVPLGSALILLASLIGCFGSFGAGRVSPDVRLSLNMAALVTWWIAAFVFCFGSRIARTLVFPLCFLYWLVPIPETILNARGQWLTAKLRLDGPRALCLGWRSGKAKRRSAVYPTVDD